MAKILLFYKYIDIQHPEALMKWHKEFCGQRGMTGRVLIGKEGINGTLGSSDEAALEYITAMQQNPLFTDVDFKTSEGGPENFPKLRVVVRDEIVRLGIDPQTITAHNGGTHLKPEEAHALLASKPENLVILDARNTYESRVGTFKDAITPEIENFRDLPKYLDEHEKDFKDKQVLMFCTGGIRCERASAYLKSKNIAQEVFQIEGGIHRYIEKFPNGFFRGKNYVFDGRISVRANDDILGTCHLCGVPNDDYTNCLNTVCNLQFLACQKCLDSFKNTCSTTCKELVENNKVGIRQKQKAAKVHSVNACSL